MEASTDRWRTVWDGLVLPCIAGHGSAGCGCEGGRRLEPCLQFWVVEWVVEWPVQAERRKRAGAASRQRLAGPAGLGRGESN